MGAKTIRDEKTHFPRNNASSRELRKHGAAEYKYMKALMGPTNHFFFFSYTNVLPLFYNTGRVVGEQRRAQNAHQCWCVHRNHFSIKRRGFKGENETF